LSGPTRTRTWDQRIKSGVGAVSPNVVEKLGACPGGVESRRMHPGTETGKLMVLGKPVYKRGPWDVATTSLVTRLA
jgi:hypothetical protein